MKYRLVNENFRSNYGEQLLTARGVVNLNQFLHPNWDDIQTPFSFVDMVAGVELLHRVISEGGRIGLIVDSDLDGYSSAAVFYQYVKLISPGTDIDYFLHQHKAHGLEEHIDEIENSNIHYDLIIQPDSGR